MDDIEQRWMAYIDAEVAAVCREKGWGHQIRRKWSVREKPVAQSQVDDYEWKLVPDGNFDSPEAPPSAFDDGVYYVLGFDRGDLKFVLQHDTTHCGTFGDHWSIVTNTEIHVGYVDLGDSGLRVQGETKRTDFDSERLPYEGWLRRFLLTLTAKFQPNHFSFT